MPGLSPGSAHQGMYESGPSGATTTVVVSRGKHFEIGSQTSPRRIAAAAVACRSLIAFRQVAMASSIGEAGPISTVPHRPALGQHEADVARCPALTLLPLHVLVLLEAACSSPGRGRPCAREAPRRAWYASFVQGLLGGQIRESPWRVALEPLFFRC